MNEYILNIAKNKYNNLIIDNKGDVNVFSSEKEEYKSLRSGVALRDVSSNVLLKFIGNNVNGFLDRLVTNKLDSLEENKNSSALFTNQKGKIIEKARLLNMENMLFLSGSADNSKKILKWIERYIFLEDILFEDVGEQYFQLEILGEQKDAFMSLICEDAFSKIHDSNIVHISINNYNFFVTFIKEYGIEKYFLFGNSEYLEPIAEYLFGEDKLFDLKLVGNSAYNIFRIEQGTPIAPNELNDFHNPFEVGLEEEVNIEKKSFIGHEVFHYDNINEIITEKLVPFVFDSEFACNGNLEISDSNDIKIGKVSSLVKSELLNKYVGLVFINKNYLNTDAKIFAYNGKDKFQIKQINLPLR